MSIGTTIKTLRRGRDLTQEELAEVLGVSAKAVSQWENERTAPDLSQIPAICTYFDISAACADRTAPCGGGSLFCGTRTLSRRF